MKSIVVTAFNVISRYKKLNIRHTSIVKTNKNVDNYFNFVISRLFHKWCSNGVVNAISRYEIIDFTGFSGTFQDTIVANKKYSYHIFQT